MAAPARFGQRDPEELVHEFLRTRRPELKDLIIVQYGSMVERIARKYAGIEPLDDLVQVGYIGLLNALSKYDPEAGVRFNTYATHLVTGEIKHHLRDKTQVIRHPAWLQELRHKVGRAASAEQARLGRSPTEDEIAIAAGVSLEAVRDVAASADLLRVASLDATPGDDEDGDSDIDRLDSAMLDQNTVSLEERLVLEDAISQLRDLEQQVLILFHFESLNQSEIADRLDISCNYVSHILRQSHSKLRQILTAEHVLTESDVVTGTVLDSATGLYSEKYVRSRLAEEIHRVAGTGDGVSVILIRLTGMKAYAQFYGADGAVELLSDFGENVKSCVRGLDVVGRYGSSGFAVILPATGASVHIACRRIVQRSKTWLLGRVGPSSQMELRIGCATAPTHAQDLKAILEMASPGPVELVMAAA